jgi:glycine oxidase
MSGKTITIVGAGVFGVWQAYRLALAGHRVKLVEASATPFADAASRYAGAMLAPWCEGEAAEPIVRDLGIAALGLWRAAYPGIAWQGTLVVAPSRDRAELVRFARLTENHRTLSAADVASLEPDLGTRFATGLLYADEGHMDPIAALSHLLAGARAAGAEIAFGAALDPAEAPGDVVIDCRGLAARAALPRLRGVRGERIVVRAEDVALTRCVRLLHPRHPLYVVPWSDRRYLIGATVVESEDTSAMSVRSALELLGAAYAVHPGFAEAEIVDLGAGVRPAFPDNVPAVIVRDRTIYVNGAYRHGFLLGPVLAEAVAGWIERRAEHPLLQIAAG